MGIVYDHLSNYTESIKALEESLKAMIQTYGPEHEKVAYCMNKLAIAQVHSGQHEVSIKFFDQAMRILKQVYKVKNMNQNEFKFSEII